MLSIMLRAFELSRFESVFYDELRVRLAQECIRIAREFEDYIDGLPDKDESKRSRALALTNLEQAVMWTMRALRDDQRADSRD